MSIKTLILATSTLIFIFQSCCYCSSKGLIIEEEEEVDNKVVPAVVVPIRDPYVPSVFMKDSIMSVGNCQNPRSKEVPINEVIINDKWRIKQLLSYGGFGEVFLGHNVDSGENVAIKLEDQRVSSTIEVEFKVYRQLRGIGRTKLNHIIIFNYFILRT